MSRTDPKRFGVAFLSAFFFVAVGSTVSAQVAKQQDIDRAREYMKALDANELRNLSARAKKLNKTPERYLLEDDENFRSTIRSSGPIPPKKDENAKQKQR